MRTPILGGMYVSRSKNLAYDQCINLYPEVAETRQGKEIGALYGTPGLRRLATVGGGPIRGGRVVGDYAYVVSANQVYQIDRYWNAVLLGTIGTSTGPITMTNNNTQLLISDGAAGYVLTLPAGAPAVVASFPASGSILAFQDGFGLVNRAGTNEFNQSNLNDLSVWDATKYSTADGQPGDTVALLDLHREVWVLCENNTEVWVNAGLSGFAFQRLSGVYIQVGCVAPYSAVANVDQSVMWLSHNENGQGIAYKAEGYVPVRVSTHAVERIWATYGVISDAFAYTYQQEGHHFYVLTFPTANATWVYDLTTGYWHQRARWSNGVFNRHRSNCHFLFNNENVVGDYQNGKLYALDLDTYTDDGETKKWLRSWRAFYPGKDPRKPVSFESLVIDCQAGVDVPDGTDPLMILRWSNDGCHIWSNERFEKYGATGQSWHNPTFRRLGSTSHTHGRGRGMDRVWELSSTAAVPVAIIGADMDVSDA